ncbi:MerR family transcriptional regulator [Nonomuraea sp. NPDC059023]|uniref:MerR family transcriptional regulator n=1 Tax=unclassified Nonomuraea TaxID=2593643 RepID=UPI0036A0EEF9
MSTTRPGARQPTRPGNRTDSSRPGAPRTTPARPAAHLPPAGSETPIPASWQRPAELDDPLEGKKPRVYKVRGIDTDFFTVGQLADVLGRKAVTIRKWEREGILPHPQYRFTGKDTRGSRRLYTRAQVLEIRQIAQDEGILEPHSRPIKHTRFTERVLAMFREHQARSRKVSA